MDDYLPLAYQCLKMLQFKIITHLTRQGQSAETPLLLLLDKLQTLRQKKWFYFPIYLIRESILSELFVKNIYKAMTEVSNLDMI